jgi:diguanylate cyclase (GGDEF)-like protein
MVTTLSKGFAKGRSVRFRLFAAFVATILAVALIAGWSIKAQLTMIERAASLEAQHISQSLSGLVAEAEQRSPDSLQHYVDQLAQSGRDIVVVDLTKRGVADADPSEAGQIFKHDTGDEVRLTMQDGQPRIFEELNDRHPTGIRQIVVPIRVGGENGEIIGATILEYTQLYQTLMETERGLLIATIAISLTMCLGFTAFGFRFADGLSRRLKELGSSVARIAKGDYESSVPEAERDEIGTLGIAINQMARDLARSHAALLQHQRTLETRVLERTEELREANEKSEYLAYNDSLTDLPNRRMFSMLLERGIAQAKRHKRELAVMFFDLDRFKNINDTLGHDSGDQLLQEVSRRLTGCLRASDTVARLGGDEFVVLLSEIAHAGDVEKVAGNVLQAINRSMTLAGYEIRISASIGVSVYPRHGEDEQSLMKHADMALYRAKEDGKNTFRVFAEDMNSQSFERLALESSVRLAYERSEFEIHYQPKLVVGANRITGMEALLRWHHPELGVVSPVKFIPIAEETGLIVPIGKWVLRQACLQNVAWQKAGFPELCVAVNLSPRQFSDEHLLADITAILAETGLDPKLLELEITEGMLMQNIERSIEVLSALRKIGVKLAIDDFGTGYSSLAHLKRFPLDIIKVDRSFIRDLGDDAGDRGITEAIIAMGKTLSLTVIAEGVENREQLDFLEAHQCDEFQGFYFSKAVSADDFTKLLEKHRPAVGAAEAA